MKENLLSSLRDDLCYAARMLGKNPGFAAVAVLAIAGSAGVSQVLSSMLFGISAFDPIAFVLVPLFLLVVALMASYVPASRATKVDPMVALRYE